MIALVGSDVCVMDQLMYGITFMYCSEISCLCWLYGVYSCLYGNNSVVLLIYFNKVMVSLIGPYSCCLRCAMRMTIGVHCVLCV